MNNQLPDTNRFQAIVELLRQGKPAEALKEFRPLTEAPDLACQKVRVYLLLLNQKYPEVDSLCSKLLSRGMDHELMVWRGIARAEMGLWYRALEDFSLSQDFFPLETTWRHLTRTTERACASISEGMRLDGGTFQDFVERARIYLLSGDELRGQRDLQSAEKLQPAAPELDLLRARVAVARGELDEAATGIEKYLRARADDFAARLLKVKIMAWRGRLRIALSLLRRLRRENPSDEIRLLKIARCRFEIGDFHGAVEDFSAILQSHPDSSSALLGRGQCQQEIRRTDEAIRDFEAALRAGGANAAILTFLADAQLATGLKQEASSNLKTARRLEPENWRGQLSHAKLKNMRGQTDAALQRVAQLRRQHPGHPEMDLFLGSVCFERGEFAAASDHFSDALSHSQTPVDQAYCLYQRGSARLENQQATAAITDLDRALQLRPLHVGTLVWRGLAKARQGKWAEAIEDLQSAIDLNPLASEKYQQLGTFIAQHALKHFAAAIQSDRQDAAAHFNRGMAYLFLEQPEQAAEDFRRALQLDPRHAEAQARLGKLYLRQGQSKQAYRLFTEAIRSRSDATVLLLRAEAMVQLGVRGPALVDIKDAIRTSRNDFRLYLRRGELYAAIGRAEKALDDFELSIALHFDNFQAFRERGRLLAARNQLAEAVRDFSLSLHFNYRQPGLLVERGQLQLKRGHHREAAADFEQALAFVAEGAASEKLSDSQRLDAALGRARAMQAGDRAQEALGWLTKAIHRFSEPEQWARLIKARAEAFLALGRFERASADARQASKLDPEPGFAADCYYLRALCSHYHRQRQHAVQALEKALTLDENHARAEQALDWFNQMADQPPTEWHHPPAKVRPQRPPTTGDQVRLQIPVKQLDAAPPMDLWLVKKDDQEFGPIPLKTLTHWIDEGRIDHETRLFRTDWGTWKKAGQLESSADRKSRGSQPD